MSKFESWGMNLFVLNRLVDQRPLTAVTYTIFKVSMSGDVKQAHEVDNSLSLPVGGRGGGRGRIKQGFSLKYLVW